MVAMYQQAVWNDHIQDTLNISTSNKAIQICMLLEVNPKY